jgi:hypothetical protein
MPLPMLGQGRSPHLIYRPEQIDVGLDDVKGLGPLRDEVTKTLNLFLGYATGAPSLLARRSAPPAALADPGRDG